MFGRSASLMETIESGCLILPDCSICLYRRENGWHKAQCPFSTRISVCSNKTCSIWRKNVCISYHRKPVLA